MRRGGGVLFQRYVLKKAFEKGLSWPGSKKRELGPRGTWFSYRMVTASKGFFPLAESSSEIMSKRQEGASLCSNGKGDQ